MGHKNTIFQQYVYAVKYVTKHVAHSAITATTYDCIAELHA